MENLHSDSVEALLFPAIPSSKTLTFFPKKMPTLVNQGCVEQVINAKAR